MTNREQLARWILAAIMIGLPLGILGYRYVVRPLLDDSTIFIRAYVPENNGFVPGVIEVMVGEPVTLTFGAMDVTHGVAIGPAIGVDLGHIDPGEQGEVTLTFDEAGTFTYYCTTWCSPDHWRMRGIIIVRDPVDPDALPPREPDPVIDALTEAGVDLDARHHENYEPMTLSVIPSATRGEALAAAYTVPDELTRSEWQRTHTPAEAAAILQATNADLDDTAANDIAAYLWTTTLGDTQIGAALYNQNCAACHGETGFAEGPGARFTPVEPSSFGDLAYMFSMRGDVLYAKTRRGGMGTNMPNFGTVFTREETWALVDHLWTLALQSEMNDD